MDKIKDMLGERIEADIQKLSTLESGSSEKASAVEDLSKLYSLRIEEIKAEEEKINRESQRKSQIIDRFVKAGIIVGSVIVECIAYDIWHRRNLRFEETGTFCSPQSRNLMSRMLPSIRTKDFK